LENGKTSPTADNLILLARFAYACFAQRKLKFLVNPATKRPFSYGELLQILTEELDPQTGELTPFMNGFNGNGKKDDDTGGSTRSRRGRSR
jgi:hypothetical protein